MPINRSAIEHFFATVQLRQRPWGSHGIPRASSIGNDLLQQYFGLMNHKYPGRYTPTDIDGESLWGMEEGHWQEPEIYQVLREEGYLVTDVQGGAIRYIRSNGETDVILCGEDYMADTIRSLVTAGHKPILTMHIDGVLEGGPDNIPPTLLELKKATMFSYGGMAVNGVREEKRTYWYQASVCAASFGLSTARMMVFSRDRSATNWYFTKMRTKNPITENPALYIEDMIIDPRLVQMADLRAVALLDAVEREEPPAPDPGVWPLNVRVERDGSTSQLFPCGWCDVRTHCVDHLMTSGTNMEPVVVQDLRPKPKAPKPALHIVPIPTEEEDTNWL